MIFLVNGLEPNSFETYTGGDEPYNNNDNDCMRTLQTFIIDCIYSFIEVDLKVYGHQII